MDFFSIYKKNSVSTVFKNHKHLTWQGKKSAFPENVPGISSKI